MILAVDVDYRESCAIAAAVIFECWTDSSPLRELTAKVNDVADYIPGQFYRRELPCIQAVLAQQSCELTAIIVDGYVYLGAEGGPGLGKHLWDMLGGQTPVIGVAKNAFQSTPPVSEILRGTSQKPLYITSVGIELSVAKSRISSMHGSYRIPTLLKRVDALCRQTDA